MLPYYLLAVVLFGLEGLGESTQCRFAASLHGLVVCSSNLRPSYRVIEYIMPDDFAALGAQVICVLVVGVVGFMEFCILKGWDWI